MLLLAMLVCLAGVAMAAVPDVWHVADSVTVVWDAVTTNADGGPLAEGTIEYEIVAACQDKADPVPLWRGSETTAVITLPDQGRYLLGIKAILMVDGEQVAQPDYGWTDDPEVVAGGDIFGLMFFRAPGRVKNLGKQ
jgi:hypothetical protein